jgi:hypothetical protein
LQHFDGEEGEETGITSLARKGSEGAEEVDVCGDVEIAGLSTFLKNLSKVDWTVAFSSHYIFLYNMPMCRKSLCLLSRIVRNWGPSSQTMPLPMQSQCRAIVISLGAEVSWLFN